MCGELGPKKGVINSDDSELGLEKGAINSD